MLKFKRTLKEGMRGPDAKAVKLALGKAGHGRGLVRNRVFGPTASHRLAEFQHAKSLRVDGVYGPLTHEHLRPYFSAYARWLYRRTHVSAYVNPFSASTRLAVGRVDMGVDYHGDGPIKAIGDAVITGLAGAGWPGGHYLLYRLLDGHHAGRYVYVAEGIVPTVRVGQRVRAGDIICHFAGGFESEVYPGIETGWGSPVAGLTRAAEMGNTGGFAHSDSPAGLAFARFLRNSCHAPAPRVWFGPDYV